MNKYNVIHLDIASVWDFHKEDLVESIKERVCKDFKKEEENALLLPTAAHRFTVSEYIEHLPAYEMKGSGLPVQTPGLQKAAFLIM